MEKLKAVIYTRVSTSLQASEGESLDLQLQQCTDFIKSKGWELVSVYTDSGQSGAKIEHRLQFQQMVKDAKQGNFNVIVFTKLSRFARSAREFQNMVFELEQNKVYLVSIKENLDPFTKTGKLIAGILSLFAEFEKETIQEQMNDSKMARWKESRSFVGKMPFGYFWNKAKKEIQVIEKEAEIYLKVVNLYLYQSLSLRDIAIKFNNEGVTTIRIKKDGSESKRVNWCSGTISSMLKNPCYYGNYIVNTVKYEHGKKGEGTKRTKILKPLSENITFPIPAIINKTQWDLIQQTANFRKIKSKHSGEHTNKFLLRNVIICERCGGKLNAQLSKVHKDGTYTRYYVCYWSGTGKRHAETNNRHHCDLPYIKAEKIENAVWVDLMMMFSLNPSKAFGDVFNVEKQKERITELQSNILHCQGELVTKNRVKERLYKLLINPELDTNELTDKLKINKNEILTLESLVNDYQNKLKDIQSIQERENKTMDFLSTNKSKFAGLRKELHNLCDSDKKILIESMLNEPAKVNYQEFNEDDPESGEGATIDFKLHFNPDIIKRFIGEGKIKELSYDSLNYYGPGSSVYYCTGSFVF